MWETSRATRHVLLGTVLVLGLLGTGCVGHHAALPLHPDMPRELAMTSHPPHVVEPGDQLLIVMRSLPLPKPPYRIRVLDTLRISLDGGVPAYTFDDVLFIVEPDGVIRVATPQGSVVLRVEGLTLEQAGKLIEKTVTSPPHNVVAAAAIVTLEEGREMDPVPDAALVRPDGTISLGAYGLLHVAGLTEQQVRTAIEEQLSEFFMKPEVLVEVSAENYKGFFLILENAAGGDTVTKVPLAGRETVLEIVATLQGIPLTSDSHRMWIARPAPADAECDQILLVDWDSIVKKGRTATNYQLLPGDRLYIRADPWIKLDSYITKVTAPIVNLSNFAQHILNVEEQFRLAITSANGLFGSGFFGFGFPGFGLGF